MLQLYRCRLIVVVLVGAVAACAQTGAGKRDALWDKQQGVASAMDTLPDQQLGASFVKAGIKELRLHNYPAAQAGFNRALKFDPKNSQLHFLNGLTYHLRAAAGDTSHEEYAAIGYELALQYDSANYWAAYQIGQLNFSNQLYRKAQDAFAYALLFAPEEPALIKALATASYYAQDLETAAVAIHKAERILPFDGYILRLASLVNAARGEISDAKAYLARYQEQLPEREKRRADYLQRRVKDWERFYLRSRLNVAQSDTGADINYGDNTGDDDDSDEPKPTTSDILGKDNTRLGLNPSSEEADDGENADDDEGFSAAENVGKAVSGGAGATPRRMAMVDVVIIRAEESLSTDKGVNLLSGLTATLAGTTYSLNSTRTANDAGTGPNTLVNTFTYAPTLSVAATYSLNILNDNNDHNEVLARPSLVALDGKKSEFFTGSILHVQLTGVAGSEGTVADVPVGIRLSVTPVFLSDDSVELNVDAARAFLENRSDQIGFSNFTQITKTEVTAHVVMKFGDTLILSGLSEKESEKLNDGVPLLQDIPGLQYLFSHEDTLDYSKSVLILLTPRKPRYTYQDGSTKTDRSNPEDAQDEQPNLSELKSRPDWFRPRANMDSVFEHLKAYRFFKEFRTGDITLEKWNNPRDLSDRIKHAIDFLYF